MIVSKVSLFQRCVCAYCLSIWWGTLFICTDCTDECMISDSINTVQVYQSTYGNGVSMYMWRRTVVVPRTCTYISSGGLRNCVRVCVCVQTHMATIPGFHAGICLPTALAGQVQHYHIRKWNALVCSMRAIYAEFQKKLAACHLPVFVEQDMTIVFMCSVCPWTNTQISDIVTIDRF